MTFVEYLAQLGIHVLGAFKLLQSETWLTVGNLGNSFCKFEIPSWWCEVEVIRLEVYSQPLFGFLRVLDVFEEVYI